MMKKMFDAEGGSTTDCKKTELEWPGTNGENYSHKMCDKKVGRPIPVKLKHIISKTVVKPRPTIT